MGKLNDISGQKYGMLTVLKTYSEQGRTWADYVCECGTLGRAYSYVLTKGITRSCGCIQKDDLTGQIFGRLTVLWRDPSKDPKHRLKWICECICGTVKSIFRTCLKDGSTLSCGCYRDEVNTKHGLAGSRLNQIYDHMIHRCYNSENDHWKHYGGRGITVCEEWRGPNGRQVFFIWAEDSGYKAHLTIDRILVNGNYEPSNCKWSTKSEQARNKRNNRLIEYKGETLLLIEAVEKYSTVPYKEVHRRLSRGWDLEDALLRPRRQKFEGRYIKEFS